MHSLCANGILSSSMRSLICVFHRLSHCTCGQPMVRKVPRLEEECLVGRFGVELCCGRKFCEWWQGAADESSLWGKSNLATKRRKF